MKYLRQQPRWCALMDVAVAAVAAGFLWPSRNPTTPILSLPSGFKLQYATMTYGTNHVHGAPLFHQP